MAKETAAFLHDSNARHDPKLKALRRARGKAAICDFWTLAEILREQEGCRYDIGWKFAWVSLGDELDMTPEEAKQFVMELVEDFGLLKTDGKWLWSQSLVDRVERYEQAREARRERASKAARSRYEKPSQQTDLPLGAPYAQAVLKQCPSSAQAVLKQCSSSARAEREQSTPNINRTRTRIETEYEPEPESEHEPEHQPPEPEIVPDPDPDDPTLEPYLARAEAMLEQPRQQRWTLDPRYMCAQRRPMRKWPRIWLSKSELARSLRVYEDARLDFELALSLVDTRLSSNEIQGRPGQFVSVFAWLCGWTRSEVARGAIDQKNLERAILQAEAKKDPFQKNMDLLREIQAEEEAAAR